MFRHIGIVTRNIEDSVKFYAIFGFELLVRKHENSKFIDTISNTEKSNLITTRLVNADGDMIELLEYHDDLLPFRASLFGIGLAHFALTINSFEILRHTDVELLHKPTIDPEGKAKVAFCRTPEGALIELVELI